MEIGMIGLGDMGLMYAKRIVKAGWRYCTFISSIPLIKKNCSCND